MKKAKNSSGGEYECQQPWPENCIVQCGGRGIVFTDGSSALSVLHNSEEYSEIIKAMAGVPSKKEHYVTSFFEAFPEDRGFFRGEGKTVAEAEEKAFEKYQNFISCTHDYDRKGSESGWAECTKCHVRGIYLEPLTKCCKCQIPTYYSQDLAKNWYCDEHYYEVPVELLFILDGNETESIKDEVKSFNQNKAQMKSLKAYGFNVHTASYKKMKEYLLKYFIHCEILWRKDVSVTEREIQEGLCSDYFISAAIEKVLNLYPDLDPKKAK